MSQLRFDADLLPRLEALYGTEDVRRRRRLVREAPPQLAYLGPAPADLPEETSLSERAVRREIPVLERADALGDEPVEAPHAANVGVPHSLTRVREYRKPRDLE